MMVQSRYNPDIPFFLLAATACSFIFSLFLLQLFAGLLVILWLFESRENKKNAFDTAGRLILLFGFMRLISILLSSYPSESIQSLYKEALFYAGFFVFNFYIKIFYNKKLNNIVFLFAGAASLVALSGLVLFNLGLVSRAQSFSSGYMAFSSYLMALSALAVFLYPLLKNKRDKLLLTLGLVIIYSGIITSLGRANAAVAAAVFAAAVVIGKIKFKYAVVIVVLTIGISWLSFLNNQQEVTQRIENPTGSSDRDIIYRTAGELLWEKPLFGFGPRTFRQVFTNWDMLGDKDIGSWHNDLMQMYFDGGLFGVTTFLMLVLIPLWQGINVLRKPGMNPGNKILLTGIIFSIAALFVSSLASGFITSPVLSVLFAFLLALLCRFVYAEL
jgi:O-antigen ligase